MYTISEEEAKKQFKKIRNYPVYGLLSILIGFIVGIYLFYSTPYPLIIFLPTIIGVAIYVALSYRYKCPNCKAYLWYIKEKRYLKNCPNCNIPLQ